MATLSPDNVHQPSASLKYSPIERTWMIRRSRWALNAGSFVLSPIVSALQLKAEEGELPIVLLVLIAAVNLSIQTFFIWSTIRLYRDLPDLTQTRRDSVAEVVDWQLQHADAHIPFVLYLRPFLTTGHLTRRTRRGRVRTEFESSLVDAVSHWCPAIGLGNPSAAHVGVGRIFAQDDLWQQVVHRLAESSDAILLLLALGDSEATAWELQLIRENGWLWKTIAIMPPASDDVDVAVLWRATADRLRHSQIQLPVYRPEGALFRIAQDGSPAELQALPEKWYRKRLRQALEPFREPGE